MPSKAFAVVLSTVAACLLQAGQVVPGWYADPQIRRYGDAYWMFPTYSHAYDESTFFDVFSSKDLETWTKHPHALDIKDVVWAHRCMWAPDAHEKDGRYYLFFSANDTYPVDGSRTGTVVRAFGDRDYGGIGVAVADRPEGPYRDLIGRPLIDQFWNGAQPIDQYVFTYKGEWYMVYGGWGRCNLVKLAPDFRSLLPLDEKGTMWRDMTPKDYVEGSVMFERRGIWYFMYSSGVWTKDDYRVNYSTASSPFGPFTFKGTVLSVQPPLATGAGHHSVICLPGTDDWRICYHRRPIPSLSPYHRVACIDRLEFAENGDILPVRMTPSAVGDFADLETASAVLVDGEVRPGVVRLEADGRLLVRSGKPFSRIEIEWPVALSPDAEVFGGDFERTYGDAGWRPVAESAKRRAAAWYCLVSQNGRTDGYGVAVQPNVFASWEVSAGCIRLNLDCRAGLSPVELGGRTLEACRLVSRRGAPGERAFDAARAFCRMMCPHPRLPKEPVYGYNDWYCAYGRNTATNFLADAAFVVSLVKGETTRPYVVVDDGWQLGKQATPRTTAALRWTGANEKWGMPMDELARRVKALDARPGLWYRPFLPDDVPAEDKGLPIDPTDPALAARIRGDLARFVDWGYEMVKIDFLAFDWCGAWGLDFGKSPVVREDLPPWRDRSRTSAEVVKGLYALMRESVGENAVLIGCNAVDHFAAGLFELQRTGDDTSGREWARTREMGPNTLGMRAIHNDVFYRVDGDCFGLAQAGAVPWALNSQWLDLIARSGTALFVSWKRELTTPESRAALEGALRRAAHVQPTGEPLDWMENPRPAKWRFGTLVKTYDWGSEAEPPAATK